MVYAKVNSGNTRLGIALPLAIATCAASLWLVLTSPSALAHCTGTGTTHVGVGGFEDGVDDRGSKATVLVNNFSQHTTNTWRAIAIFKNSNNFVEVGWTRLETHGNDPYAYKTDWEAGVETNTDHHDDIVFAEGNYYDFKVHDQNGDNLWSFNVGSVSLGNVQNYSVDNGKPVTQSEKKCSSDSLFAKFRNLEKCHGQNCSWANYGDLDQFVNVTDNWHMCYGWSNTAYNVRKDCSDGDPDPEPEP